MRQAAEQLSAWLGRKTPEFRGKQRAIRAVQRILGEHEFVVKTDDGTFQVDTGEHIERWVAYSGAYERHMIDFLASRLRSDSVLWDIGANIGAISIPLAWRMPSLRVVCFEPNPEVRKRLERNIALNPSVRDRLTVRDVALGKTDEILEFYRPRDTTNRGLGSLTQRHNTQSDSLPLQCCRIDREVERLGTPPSLLKIDTEGHELEVLEGAAETLRQHSPLIVFEHSPYQTSVKRTDAIRELLQGLDYSLDVLSVKGELTRLTRGSLKKHCDLVAVYRGERDRRA